jgi:DNA modification methylase
MSDWTIDLMLGDCLEMMAEIEDGSVDSVVCDPPYGLSKEPDMAEVLRHWLAGDDYKHKGKGFMGKTWDSFVPGPSVWRECLRVLKPGGHLVAFFGTRTYDMGTLAIRLAGFEVRDQLAWVYGCLDERTEVATKDGVKPYHKTRAGDLVLCYDAATGAYSYQPILEVVEYDYEDTAYRLVGDFGEQVVSRNHRCIVERDGAEVFVFAEDAAREQQARIPILESLPELRDALSNAHQRAGRSQQDVQRRVQAGADRSGERGGAALGAPQGACGGVRGLREGRVEAGCLAEACGVADMQQRVQRPSARRGVGEARPQGARDMDVREGGSLAAADDGCEQSFVEGWADLPQAEGCVCGSEDQLRSLPGNVRVDGAQGRVCDGASAGYSAVDWSSADSDGVRASHQPRCDGQSVGEPDPVQDQRGTQEVRAWRGHKTAVVRIEPFRYVGKVWCLRVPTGAFVAVRDGVAFPTGNSGFPKSLDVSKAIDKAAGADPVDLGPSPNWRESKRGREKDGRMEVRGANAGRLTSPATNAARQWEGWGTALKPAWEPICLARKPLIGTVAANVLEHGTGALNIDGCRVAYEDTPNPATNPLYRVQNGYAVKVGSDASGSSFSVKREGGEVTASPLGRWPANFVHDGSDEVVGLFPDSNGQQGDVRGTEPSRTGGEGTNCYGEYGRVPAAKRNDGGGSAARFFYAAKASKKDRDEGLDAFEKVRTGGMQATADGSMLTGSGNERTTRRANIHPTVKPTDLMRYLCRLITPPNGIVLDPFMGSGSTGKAAMREGFRFIGIERDEGYFDIAEARIMAAKEGKT